MYQIYETMDHDLWFEQLEADQRWLAASGKLINIINASSDAMASLEELC